MEGWRVAGVELLPLDDRAPSHKKWCYKVNFIEPVDPEEKNLLRGEMEAGFLGKATVFVSMDGTPGGDRGIDGGGG